MAVLAPIRGNPTIVIALVMIAVIGAMALLNTRIAPGNPFTTSAAARFQSPSTAHLMGTDQLGRDIFTGVVRGARTSMSIVLGVAVISTLIGLLVGTLAGLRGGVVDDVAMRAIELVQTVPRFFLAILVVGWFGAGAHTLVVLLGLTSWPFLARVVRAETLSLREREFVAAARSAGASEIRVACRHLLPNVAPAALVVIALTASRVVLLEASLAFLGLADPNVPSWGALINNAQPYLARAWWMSVFPGLAIVVAVLGMNLLADALNEVLSPVESPDPLDDPQAEIATVV